MTSVDYFILSLSLSLSLLNVNMSMWKTHVTIELWRQGRNKDKLNPDLRLASVVPSRTNPHPVRSLSASAVDHSFDNICKLRTVYSVHGTISSSLHFHPNCSVELFGRIPCLSFPTVLSIAVCCNPLQQRQCFSLLDARVRGDVLLTSPWSLIGEQPQIKTFT